MLLSDRKRMADPGARREVVRPQASTQPPQNVVLAPISNVDKSPIIIGSNLTFQYISACQRQALNGYRQPWVDVLRELLEHDGHTFSALSKRMQAISCARWEWTAADDSPEAERICDEYEADEKNIFDTQMRAGITGIRERLMWHGTYYSAGAEEIVWKRADDHWTPIEMRQVHTRRLIYPNYKNWELAIYDQGVGGVDQNGGWGLTISEHPNKFVVYTPQLSGEYPTREGLGIVLSTFMAILRIVTRVSAQDFERFVKPWVVAYYSTGFEGKPRVALEEDIDEAQAATAALGVGSLASAVLPDSIRVEILNQASKLTHKEMIEWLESVISKVCQGQTFTTQPGKYGSKGSQDIGKEDQVSIAHADALKFGDAWVFGLTKTWMRLNYPGKDKLAPRLTIHVEREPDPLVTTQVAVAQVSIGQPIDGRKLAERTGMPIVDESDMPDAPSADGSAKVKGKSKPIQLHMVAAVDPSRMDHSNVAPPPEPKIPAGAAFKPKGDK